MEIGNNVTIRECATINRGTQASGKGVTRIGDDTLIMSYVHVAHDCRVGNHCILVSYVGIAGETDVDDWAIIGGNTAVHQFSHIGAHAMVGGCSAVNKDIPPYSICGRTPSAMPESTSSACAGAASTPRPCATSRTSTTRSTTRATTFPTAAPRLLPASPSQWSATPYSSSSRIPSGA